MADSLQTSVLHQIQDLPAYENAGNSTNGIGRDSAGSITRLEFMISHQEDRLDQIRQLSIGTPSQIRLKASMEGVLRISKRTLTQIRQSATCLEFSSAMLASWGERE